ncbi:MAG TPA: ornithine cyclodeaminase family protein [Intrasporangiaceae bacterium]|nr:ornithine cyclodeaminase family protein [Intrasporangiaceae bacterium]
MRTFDADQVQSLLDPAELIEALRAGFAGGEIEVPDRGLHALGEGRTLFVKPAWQRDGWLGIKLATHHPHNGERGLPAIHASYVLIRAETGEPVAVMDGTELTRLRTAAASALAADYLAPAQVRELLLIGAGNVCAAVPAHYARIRDVAMTRVWARKPDQAQALVARLLAEGHRAEVAPDLRAGVATADVITAATSSTEPLILGADVRAGSHVDLIGSFTTEMTEADEDLMRRARIFVDIPAAIHETGELAGLLARGELTEADVCGDLADLAAGRHPGRRSPEEVTVFSSVGSALEDLVAAVLVWERAGEGA